MAKALIGIYRYSTNQIDTKKAWTLIRVCGCERYLNADK
jgi:hypothetical protein